MKLVLGLVCVYILAGCTSKGEIFLQPKSQHCTNKGDAYVIRNISESNKVEFQIRKTPMYGSISYLKVTLAPLKEQVLDCYGGNIFEIIKERTISD